jgi:small subunit ribosomal protein S14
MKNLIQKDKKKRKMAFTFENNRFILKSIIKNKKIALSIKYNAILKLDALSKNSSKNKFNNYCILTYRKKGILSKFKMSRLAFLKFSRMGQISGIKKSVW